MSELLKKFSFSINAYLYRILKVRVTRASTFGSETKLTDQAAHVILQSVKNRTMTSESSLYNLIEAVRYIELNKIEGDFVECGVWRGGSIIAVLKTLESVYSFEREIYLYDTFEGMTKPINVDKSFLGSSAIDVLHKSRIGRRTQHQAGVIAYSTLSDVRTGIEETNYPSSKIHYIVGDVIETLKSSSHKKIALLRLDTDWYESTKAELEHLWDSVSSGGIVILDDYDYWQGARKAVDEFFQKRGINLFKMKLTSGGRIIIKN